MSSKGITIDVENLDRTFNLGKTHPFAAPRQVKAVQDASFSVKAGTTFGLVGESGSGKTTIARMLLKLDRPTSGKILMDGKNILEHSAAEQAEFRKRVSVVFQDPYASLSPRLRVDKFVGEPLEAQKADKAFIKERVRELFPQVGLPLEMLTRYPHEFSGGQRQRLAIARALSTNPGLLVLDEPIAALDVSISAQILHLLRDMQRQLGLTYVFIGHDLSVVRFLSTDVGVMYFGRIVEQGRAGDVLRAPLHPYSRRLVAVASGKLELGAGRMTGEMPDPLSPPSGCIFRTRCTFATARCAEEVPLPRPAADDRLVACHHFEEIEARETGGAPVASSRPARTAEEMTSC